jgi:hypothetical protein
MDMPVLAKVPGSAAGLLRVSGERLGSAAPLVVPFDRLFSRRIPPNLFVLLSGSTSKM